MEIKSKLKVIKLEDKVKQQENEIKALNTKMKYVEKRNEIIEKQLKGGLESLKVISEAVVKEATDTVVRIISKQQDESKKRSKALFDALNQQLYMITKYLIPPPPNKYTKQPS